jgi:tellurite methyltransferase
MLVFLRQENMYWEEFYKAVAVTDEPSSFAIFCERFIDKSGNNFLLDIGCGNARDTRFFYGLGLDASGIDYCETAIGLNKLKYPEQKFTVCDVLGIEELSFERAPRYIYTRFFLHAIDKISATTFLSWASSAIDAEGYLFIECRSDNDPMFGVGVRLSDDEYVNGHYRRFINLKALVSEVDGMGWSVVYCSEASDLSVVGNDNPVLLRLVLKKSAFRIPKPNLYLLKIRPDVVGFVGLLKEAGIQIFATCGTLLGAIRCEGITPWDTDVDIGIFYSEFLKLINLLRGGDYFISSDGVDASGIRKRYHVDTDDLISKFDFANELIWLHDQADSYYIQINIFEISDEVKPRFWEDFHGDRFAIHLNRELRDGYGFGRYNIPFSLFYPLIEHPFYETALHVHEKSEQILKRWYGDKCLTHYPKSSESSLDLGRFVTTDARIDYLYGI